MYSDERSLVKLLDALFKIWRRGLAASAVIEGFEDDRYDAQQEIAQLVP